MKKNDTADKLFQATGGHRSGNIVKNVGSTRAPGIPTPRPVTPIRPSDRQLRTSWVRSYDARAVELRMTREERKAARFNPAQREATEWHAPDDERL